MPGVFARASTRGMVGGWDYPLGKDVPNVWHLKIYIPKLPTGTREAQEDDQRLLREAEQAMELLESYFRGAPKLDMR